MESVSNHDNLDSLKGKNGRLKVAVVGSGISAISAAWFLSQKHDVVLYEKQSRLGGHTNTIEVSEGDKQIHVDTGFIVFNRPNYPHLSAMFDHLNVKTQNTDMSFAVSINSGQLEYSGTNLNGLFAQRRNLFSASHWSMILEIMRFNKTAKQTLKLKASADQTLAAYLSTHDFSEKMRDRYLLPMAAAIWSCPVETMMQFPARSFLQFFENHGLLNIEDRPQWETVVNGSKSYIDAILNNSEFTVQLDSPVTAVSKLDQGLKLEFENGHSENFDQVVLGCHADEAYDLLSSPLKDAFSPLKHFEYQQNIAFLHTDKSLMPTRKRAWSSWNYLRDLNTPEKSVAVSYWMNLLQGLEEAEKDYFVTLNPIVEPSADQTVKRIVYEHPVFNQAAMGSQPRLNQLQGTDGIWLCGSYFGYGFHEDGLHSSVEMVKQWGISVPWQSSESADKIVQSDFGQSNHSETLAKAG